MATVATMTSSASGVRFRTEATEYILQDAALRGHALKRRGHASKPLGNLGGDLWCRRGRTGISRERQRWIRAGCARHDYGGRLNFVGQPSDDISAFSERTTRFPGHHVDRRRTKYRGPCRRQKKIRADLLHDEGGKF